MYNDTVIGLGVILLFLAGAGLLNFYEKKKGRRLFLEKMMASWGKIPQREYSYEELDHISQFFRQREKEGFYIDDITWNDLDMDRIFALINQSVSPVGDECLYDLLRKPVFMEEELKERERLLEFFKVREKERHQIHHVLSLLPVSLVFYAHAFSGDILFPGDLYPEYHYILYEKTGY